MNTKIFGFLVALMAIVFVLPSVSAFATINDVTVNGIQHYSGETAGVFAGETMGVRLTFTADENEEDVRVISRILGEPGLSDATERFDVVEGSKYSRLMNIKLPFDLDENLNEPFTLEVTVESNAELGDEVSILLEVQRENDLLEVLSIETNGEVEAGENAVFDVVLKNRGRDEAEDTFIRASIPSLGVSKRIFVGDLSPFDQGGDEPDKEDSVLGRVFLPIPRTADPGVYNVEIEAFNDDASVLTTRKLVVVGGGLNSQVISSGISKTFAAGEEKTYTVTIVNGDDRIRVYELILQDVQGLTVSLDDTMVAVPAGSTKTVSMKVNAKEEGTYDFSVNVHSDGEIVETKNFVAVVEGRTTGAAGNAAVVLTIVLVIIFIVLLIVLIVLLTRKSEKSEDFGESYY